ncbi:MAG TPA: hypothetical protein VGP18_13185 [Solirubrobacteraceae bacterium]|jgi:hypothetical protein|nr:hypothetical protein [Solirubrobacteraceae bacterium]
MPLGPFDIEPAQIERLGNRFTPFVNLLLDVEVSAQGLAGHHLAINYKENLPDGGVDAAVRDATQTDWLPVGESAWQFKTADRSPKACADELEEARWAHERIQAGGSYVLVVGGSLTDQKLERRRVALRDAAVRLGLLTAENSRDRIRVYDANMLARWALIYPALARSALLDGLDGATVDYDRWSAGAPHRSTWVEDDRRAADITSIRTQVNTPGLIELRIQGDSGIGKTRMVMEALRDSALSPLVVYIQDERDAGSSLFNHLLDRKRVAVLVIDECPADRHIKLLERLPREAEIKLITIGDVGASTTRSPVVAVMAMPDEKMEEFLRHNHPLLRSEAQRFVIDHCRGNMRWAIALADRIAGLSEGQAAELIDQGDIRQFVATFIPEGEDFFFATVLALLERVGWDGELQPQLEALAAFADTSVERLREVGGQLERQGLLSRQGRYRAVSPHPAAVVLAAEAWRAHGDRIVRELIPLLDSEMALSMFRRVADLGRFEPAVAALTLLLSHDGPFASLGKIEAGRLGPMLTQLAIVLPDEIARHLSELIDSESIEQLHRRRSVRRDLVWTLEKLAWHQRTFELAANSLLRLAMAENETYVNNATGTWVGLFGTFLPSTAASPDQRVNYLSGIARNSEPEVRLLAIKGALRALGPLHMETTTVSAEVQGGVLVEPRGTPETYGEAGAYRRTMLSLLASLTNDEAEEVARAADDGLIAELHPLSKDPFVFDALVEALMQLRGGSLRRLRSEAEQLLSLHTRIEKGDPEVVERVNALLAKLPAPTKLEELAVLAHLPRWDLGKGELQERIDTATAGLAADEVPNVLEMLNEALPAAWEIGRTLALHHAGDSVVEALVAKFEPNPIALVGYLTGLVEQGDESAFDDFLESQLGVGLNLKDRVAIASRGPVTKSAREQVLVGTRTLPVAEATAVIFGWQPNLSDDEMAGLVDDWLARLDTQADYNALIDRIMTWLFNKERLPDWAPERVARAVLARRDYPGDQGHNYEWSQLALAEVPDHGPELAQLIFDLVDSRELILVGSYDIEVLVACAQQHPVQVWNDLSARLIAGSWRVEMQLRGSVVVSAFPVDVIGGWVGAQVERARIAASIAPVEGEEPQPVARYLLQHFGDDEHVEASLAGTFMSGSWIGPESGRIATRITQLNSWRSRQNEPLGVRQWAARMVENLEVQRQAALQREAEGEF